ncbi:MAG: peptidylprolyl isomerase [Xanthomonadaceae bacterium]|nr:peptidylprolyl isomerase [Xanthomonadaceae bacterium]MDE1884770.1 peptidylprolyl isomerase [Xanthomonadaceae bacterium]MDE1961596.1 peptidylprolyl isomerase [Xanthomonadaceae bacterium]
MKPGSIVAVTLAVLLAAAAAAAAAPQPPTMDQVLAASKPSDWRTLDPQNTLYLQLATGRVVIELAPQFAPQTIANIKTLVREKYFDGLDILRVQDNYVAQWGDPNADNAAKRRTLGKAKAKVPAEFTMPLAKDFTFTPLPDRDGWAPQAGFVGDFPAAVDLQAHAAWLTHCYGTVGVGRDNDADSGNGTELYAVIASSARWLDRNITVVGRVVQGMELLSSLPRGHGDLGFYTKSEHQVPIKSVRLAADVPVKDRAHLEVLRTDTPTFAALVESRRNRHDEWYKRPAGYIDMCSVPLPVRTAK